MIKLSVSTPNDTVVMLSCRRKEIEAFCSKEGLKTDALAGRFFAEALSYRRHIRSTRPQAGFRTEEAKRRYKKLLVIYTDIK